LNGLVGINFQTNIFDKFAIKKIAYNLSDNTVPNNNCEDVALFDFDSVAALDLNSA
jgi:hypothetical protein